MTDSDRDVPVLLYDGHCRFCIEQARRLERFARGKVRLESFREPGVLEAFPGVDAQRCEREMVLVEPGGRISGGAEAFARALLRRPPLGWAGAVYFVPGIRSIADGVYRIVARNRFRLRGRQCPEGTCSLHNTKADPPATRERVRPAFLRLFGLVALVAFVSLGAQVRLLAGSEGILPARRILDGTAALFPGRALWVAPTLFWIHLSDAALVGAAALGGLASLSLALLLTPKLCLAAIWALYLSLSVACGEWLSFQWDNLLVETAFLTFFWAPWGWRPFRRGSARPENPILRFLLVWLLFRLHFESGVAKIHSGDEGWRNLTAMIAYYETAPIPTALGWWAHQLPKWAHEVAAALTLFVEGLLPFLLFGTRRFRLVALAGIVPFQVFVAATANYGFFNVLSLALCVPPLARRAPLPRGRARVLSFAFAAVVVALSSLDFASYLARGKDVPSPLREVDRAVSPWRTSNTYHLFAVMTYVRDEMEIQGSEDGVRWQAYEFRYKPGDPSRRPPLVAPHQPRVDFRFWFVPLGQNQQGPLLALVERLFERPDVVAPLFSVNPFPDRPPRWIRVARWRYTMTSLAQRRETGRWWDRTLLGTSRPISRPEIPPSR